MQIMQNPQWGFWGLIKFSISGKPEMYPEKISFLHFFSSPNSNDPVLKVAGNIVHGYSDFHSFATGANSYSY